jgi:hypothetical protein
VRVQARTPVLRLDIGSSTLIEDCAGLRGSNCSSPLASLSGR